MKFGYIGRLPSIAKLIISPYPTISQQFMALKNCHLLELIANLARRTAPTIYGIPIILQKALKFTNSIVEMFRAFGYCA
jgi:hypothetical protein